MNPSVKIAFYERDLLDGERSNQAFLSIDEQFASQLVRGAKFYDQYENRYGDIWVLTRVPLYCSLDVAENLPEKLNYGRSDNLPIYNITWMNVIEYCNQLSLNSGFIPCYIDKVGNVWEFCWNWFDESASSRSISLYGPDLGDQKVIRGAFVESTYEEDGKFWALMKYCDDCGEMLVGSALQCIENEIASDVGDILELFEDKTTLLAIMLERRLHELNLEDYNSEDISLILDGKKIVIMTMNFLSNDDELTSSREKGLTLLSRGLLFELESMNSFLIQAGIVVMNVSWKGGNDRIADVSTMRGRSRNRRVGIFVEFE